MKPEKETAKLLNKISLTFKDKNLELEYRNYYGLKIVGHVRIALAISMVLYVGFAFLDAILYPDLKSVFLQIRLYVIFPVILLTIVYTFHASVIKYVQHIVSVNIIVAAYGIIAMIYIGGGPVSTLYYVGLILIFLFNYDFLKLRFLPASISGALVLVGYLIVSLKIETEPKVLVASLFFLISANFMGMVSAYYYEILSRQYFYSQLVLKNEKQKTTDINVHLEAQVKERTSKLVKSNKELYAAKVLAEESQRLKSVFLATMSHELRTPLNAIIGFSDFISSGEIKENENIEFANLINKSGMHLLSLVDSLFDITLIDSGEVKLNPSEFNLLEVLSAVNSIIVQEQVSLGKEDIKISFIPGDIKRDFRVFSDENKLKQVLINLLKNALKFTESGEIKYWCEEITAKGNSYLRFNVSDTGIGIPKDKIELIFDVFRQADDTHSRKHGGVGIGLSVVRKLINMMGGEVGVESMEGNGSTFYFTISNYKAEDFPEADIEESPIEMKASGNKRIMVAEDDGPSFSLLELLLKKWGYEVVWAKNGEIALNMLADKQKFDLILMDMNMPVMNGFDATAQIKKLYPENIVIAQTAYAVSGDKERALAIGCDDYITKPISSKKLESMIFRFL